MHVQDSLVLMIAEFGLLILVTETNGDGVSVFYVNLMNFEGVVFHSAVSLQLHKLEDGQSYIISTTQVLR